MKFLEKGKLPRDSVFRIYYEVLAVGQEYRAIREPASMTGCLP